VQTPVQPDRMAWVNLNRVQATALADRLISTLENHEDAIAVPLPYNYSREIANIITAGLGLDPKEVAEGLGVRNGGGQNRGQGRGSQPRPISNHQNPSNPQQAQVRRPARRPASPVPQGFEHNRGPAYIPFRICYNNGGEMPVRYIRIHLEAPNPFVEGRLSLNGPTYHSKIHAAVIHDLDIPPPPITTDLLRLLCTDYMDHECVDKAIGELGDHSLHTEGNHYRHLEQKHKSFQESIRRLEDQMFTTDMERCMCVSRLEAARAMVCIQNEMQRNRQAFRLSPWSLEHGHLP
jgi:hypothetical protein